MRKIKLLLTSFLLFVFILVMQAQDGKEVEMADTMRSNGRIYVVVAVIVLILVGLILYLVRLDRKITKMEKESR